MREIYFARLAAMTPAERVRLGVTLWEAAWSLQRAAVLRENPEADEAEVRYQIALRRFGPEVAGAVFGRR